MTLDFGQLGTLISALLTFLFIVLTVLGFRSRRTNTERRELRETNEAFIATLKWATRVRRLAAVEGWSDHPNWPQEPPEMLPEYLAQRAVVDQNTEMANVVKSVAQAATELGGGKRAS